MIAITRAGQHQAPIKAGILSISERIDTISEFLSSFAILGFYNINIKKNTTYRRGCLRSVTIRAASCRCTLRRGGRWSSRSRLLQQRRLDLELVSCDGRRWLQERGLHLER